MQPGRGSEIDGGTEWGVTEFAVLVYGMRISTALQTGYAATRTATATEQSHPMTITALITNRNNKKRTQLRHKISIISFKVGMIVLNIGHTDIFNIYHPFSVRMVVSW